MRSQKRYMRYLFLLLILMGIAAYNLSVRLRTTSWDTPLQVVVFPINGDGSATSERYIGSLGENSFEPVAQFMNAQATRYGMASGNLIQVKRGSTLRSRPPAMREANGIMRNILWSLSFRLWAGWQVFRYADNSPDIALFVPYFDPSRSARLPHSAGLKKGMIGLVNAYADPAYQGSNHVIVTHELLHTLGATDKYDPNDNRPLYPIGFAEPGKMPRYPQTKAEIMGGRIPLTAMHSIIPQNLEQTVIGQATALEIRWFSQ